MGTSGSSGGSGSNTSLVPTFLELGATEPLPGGEAGQADGDDTGDGAAPGGGTPLADAPRPPIQLTPFGARFTGARTNFTRFASSGGNDRGALRRSVRDYVRSG